MCVLVCVCVCVWVLKCKHVQRANRTTTDSLRPTLDAHTHIHIQIPILIDIPIDTWGSYIDWIVR